MKYILSFFSILGFFGGLGFVVMSGKSLLWILLAFAGLGFLAPVVLFMLFFVIEQQPSTEQRSLVGKPVSA